MWFIFIKIIVIITLFLDLVGYMIDKTKSDEKKTNPATLGSAVGIILGVIIRVFALYLIWNSNL